MRIPFVVVFCVVFILTMCSGLVKPAYAATWEGYDGWVRDDARVGLPQFVEINYPTFTGNFKPVGSFGWSLSQGVDL